jgi:hypothetical protein
VYQTIRARDFVGANNPSMSMPFLALSPGRFLLIVSLWNVGMAGAGAASITLNPAQDTFIAEYISFPDSNGTGTEMIIGTQGSNVGFAKNRGLIQFDLSSIPSGAVANSVTLRLTTVTRVPSTPVSSNFELHRLARPWDGLKSTWLLRLDPDENWTVPGGQADIDFAATPSARVQVAGLDNYAFASTPELIADVNAWLADPGANHGWLVKTEDESIGFTARHFASREGSTGAPVLEVQFEAPELLRITLAEITENQFCLHFTARQGRSYVIERRDLADSGEWTAITNLPPADVTGEAVVCDPLGTGTGFYRVGER